MAATVPTTPPTDLTAGITWRWDRTLDDYPPADGWALKVRFVGDAADLTLTAVVNGTTFEFTATPSETASLAAGLYRYVEYVELGAARHVVADGTVVVRANPLTVAPGDQRSHAEVMLAKVRAAKAALVDGGAKQWTVGQRSFTSNDLGELSKLEAQYAAAVRRQRTGVLGRPVEVVMRRPAGATGDAWA